GFAPGRRRLRRRDGNDGGEREDNDSARKVPEAEVHIFILPDGGAAERTDSKSGRARGFGGPNRCRSGRFPGPLVPLPPRLCSATLSATSGAARRAAGPTSAD